MWRAKASPGRDKWEYLFQTWESEHAQQARAVYIICTAVILQLCLYRHKKKSRTALQSALLLHLVVVARTYILYMPETK